MRYSIGHRDEVAKNLTIPLGEGLTGTAAGDRQPILVHDVRCGCALSERAGCCSRRTRRTHAGSQQTCWRDRPAIDAAQCVFRTAPFSACTDCEPRATAIDNARLYRRVERQNRTLRVLAHLSQEFSSILEIDELLTKIAVTVRALINFDSFTIFLVDEEHKLLRCRFSQRYDEKATTQNLRWEKV